MEPAGTIEAPGKTPVRMVPIGLAGGIGAALASFAGAAAWTLLDTLPAPALLEYVPKALEVGVVHAFALGFVALRAEQGKSPLRLVEALAAAFVVCVFDSELWTGSAVFLSTSRLSSAQTFGRALRDFAERPAAGIATTIGLGMGYWLACRLPGRGGRGVAIPLPYALMNLFALATMRGGEEVPRSVVENTLGVVVVGSLAVPLLERAFTGLLHPPEPEKKTGESAPPKEPTAP